MANPYLIKNAYALDPIYFEKTSLTVEPGTATVTLSPTVTQSALVAVYVWLKDGISLGINNNTLTLSNVDASDAGTYQVIYLDGIVQLGSASITLNIGETVTLTNQTVTEGQPLSLTSNLLVTADNPLFVWSKDGSILGSETGSSITKASAEASDAGSYEVIYYDGSQELGRATATVTIDDPVIAPALSGGDTVAANATLSSQIDNGVDEVNSVSYIVGTSLTLPSGAVLTISATGALSYDPNGVYDALLDGETATDSFTVANAAGSITITLTINGVTGDEPVIAPVLSGGDTVAANTTLSRQIDNGVDTVNVVSYTAGTSLTLPSGAVLTISATGALTYDPNGIYDALLTGETATDSFTVANAAGSLTITFTINGVTGDEPVITPVLSGGDTVAANATLSSQIDNGVDEVNSVSYVAGTSLTLPSGAVLTISATGALTYDPNGIYDALLTGENATDSFTVANAAGSLTINLTINGVTGDEPVIAPALSGGDTVAANTTLSSQIDNGVDEVNGSSYTAGTSLTLPSGAVLTISATGALTYDPNGIYDALLNGESATDSFTVANAAGSLTITLTINGVTGDEPVIAPALSGGDTVAANATLSSQIDNGVDEVNSVSYVAGTSLTLPSGAVLTISATGALTYDPNGIYDALLTGESATDSFSVANAAGSLTITLTINGVTGDEPVITPALSGGDTVAANATLSSQIDNGVDEVNSSSYIAGTSLTLPSGAVLTISATGALTYDPNGIYDALLTGESATDGFTVANAAGSLTITLTINGVTGDEPVIAPALSGGDTVAANATLSSQIDNGVDEVNSVSYVAGTSLTLPSGAVLTISATGALTYDPNGIYDALLNGESATDSFSVANAAGSLTITLTINGVTGDEPVIAPVLSGGDTVAANATLSSQIDNGIDEVNSVSYIAGTSLTLPSGAVLTISATGALTYDPNGIYDALLTGESTTDSFTVANAAGSLTVTLTINGVTGDEPVIAPVLSGGNTVAANATLSSQIDNGIDEVNSVSYVAGTSLTLPSGAVLTISATGALTYDPNGIYDALLNGETATDSFTVANAAGSLTITLTINGVTGDEPVIAPALSGGDTVAANATLSSQIDNGVDEVNSVSYIAGTSLTLPSGAVLTISATGALTYDPNGIYDALLNGETATDSFTVANAAGSLTITLTINGVTGDEPSEPAGPPQITGATTTDADTILTTQIDNAIDEINGDSYTANQDYTLPSGAILNISNSGTMTYNPIGQFDDLKQDESTTESFTLSNSQGTTNITLTINGTPDAESGGDTTEEIAVKLEKAQKTQRTITNSTTRRANQITTHSPELTIRLSEVGGLPSGNPAQFMASGTLESYQLKFSTSLRQMMRAKELEKMERRQALSNMSSLGALSLTDDIANTGLDIWVRGQWSDVNTGTSESELGLLQIGIDYRYNKDLVVGFLTQFDWTDEVNNSQDTDINGKGWMAGPYMVTRLDKHLIFDAYAAWGQSDNDTRTGTDPKDNYETERWLLAARLTGDFNIENFNIQPHIGLIYFQETIKGYQDSNDIYIPGQTIELGRLTFGPKLTARFELEDTTLISPYIGARGIWDFEKAENIDIQTGLAAGTDDLRARIDGGLNIRLPNGISFHGEGFYDGIGTDSYEAIGGNVKVSIPLN